MTVKFHGDAGDLVKRGLSAIARNLREFGYPDVTTEIIHDIHEAMKANTELPHGVIGMFAQSQLRERPDIFGELP